MCCVRELTQLLKERDVPAREAQFPGGDHRLQSLDATEFVAGVADIGDRNESALLTAAAPQLVSQKLLELIGFHGEDLVAPKTVVGDYVIDDGIRSPPTHVGVKDIQQTGAKVLEQAHNGRVIGAAPGLAHARVARS